MQEEFVTLLRCPQTKQIFHTPVVASDGEVYEDQLCSDNSKIIYVALKSFVSAFLDEFPDYKNQQYKPDKVISTSSKNVIDKIMNSNDYSKITSYIKFSLNHFSHELFAKFIKNATPDQIMHVIDNLVNVAEVHTAYNWQLLNYVCANKPNDIELLKYTFEKDKETKNNYFLHHHIDANPTNEECLIFVIDEHIKRGLSLWTHTGFTSSIITKAFKGAKFNIVKHIINFIDKTHQSFNENMSLFFDIIERREFTQAEKEYLINELLS
jgi:hypothetical protein